MSSLNLPPPPILQDSIVLVREIAPGSKQVVTYYLDWSGTEVLRPTYAHQGVSGGFIDPVPTDPPFVEHHDEDEEIEVSS